MGPVLRGTMGIHNVALSDSFSNKTENTYVATVVSSEVEESWRVNHTLHDVDFLATTSNTSDWSQSSSSVSFRFVSFLKIK